MGRCFGRDGAPGVAGKVVRFGEVKEEAGPQARPGDIRQSGPPFQRKRANTLALLHQSGAGLP